MTDHSKRFNIRVYGLIFQGDKILLSHETINDLVCLKFPGGGLEWGEGILDGLSRELNEEGEIRVIEFEHFYTTGFFQVSAFNPKDQVISVYYKVKADIGWEERESDQSQENSTHFVKLYFEYLDKLEPEMLTFPIDKHVLNLLKSL